MIKQSLNGAWQFRQIGSEDWLPAMVPGGVHTDLLAAGLIPDPFIADNEKRVQWVAESDWEYRLDFVPGLELLGTERITLVAEGLDTLAEVSLNGHKLGKTENMFRSYRWELGDRLVEGANRLEVRFRSPVEFISRRQADRPMIGVDQAIEGAPHIRKAPCHFGWDWGPQLPPIGIWKDIYLQGFTAARIEDVHLRQFHHVGGVAIQAGMRIDTWTDGPLTARMSVDTPDGETLAAISKVSDGEAELRIEVENPQLWWPNGYGEQPLYAIRVHLESDGVALDMRDYQLGLRTIELRQEGDKWGQCFTFIVNGVPVFAKGANWIPADSFPTRVSQDRLEHLIRSAAETRQNMLRVWGGGFYEDERFYDLCDRYGILVWQDFIFACGIYPLDDPGFVANVMGEAIDNLRRLRHRASLALWCGNNEMDWGWEAWGWAKIEHEDRIVEFLEGSPSTRQYLSLLRSRQLHPEWETLRAAYKEFFYQTLPAWVAENDPYTPYWPSSPSSNKPFLDANGVQAGDTHNWDVWHGNLPFEGYRDHKSRFVSEFGFQSLPPLDTIRTYAEEAHWNLTSYIMEHHQRNEAGNRKILSYLGDQFRMPKDFPSLVYISQLLQAEAMRIGVEYWRRKRVVTSGTLYWQLNDCWPVASWSSLDYFGRWKALHYAARCFYAPLLLSIEDKGTWMSVHVTSDLTEISVCALAWTLEALEGEVLADGVAPVIAQPLVDTPMLELDFEGRISDEDSRRVVLVCELRQGDELIATRLATFAPDKHLELVDPQIDVQVDQAHGVAEFTLQAVSLARFVELAFEGADTIFSDNYFDLPAGRVRVVTAAIPVGWDLEKVRKALRVRSLIDSYK